MRTLLITLFATALLPFVHAQDVSPIDIREVPSGFSIQANNQGSGDYVIERSFDLVTWEPFIFTDSPEIPESISQGDQNNAYFRLRNRAAPAIWCDVLDENRPLLLALENAFNSASCTFGPPDDPIVRDQAIPDEDSPFKTISVAIHVMPEKGGNPAATLEQIDNEMARVATLYESSKIRFEYTSRFVEDFAFSQIQTDADVLGMKRTYAESPTTTLNIFIADLCRSDVGGFAIFPWDPRALTELGGIVMNAAKYDFIDKSVSVLAHEIGHTLGLLHTHRGSAEVAECGDCYEGMETVDRDTVGDFCSDTPPTPLNRSCGPASGIDPCSDIPWGETDTLNIMSYSGCLERFTDQQKGRMHAWIEQRLTPWLIEEEPEVIAAPINITATALLDERIGSVEVSWTSEGIHPHEISRSSAAADGIYTVIGEVEIGVSTFLDSDTTEKTGYSYCVQAKPLSGGGSATTCSNFVVTPAPIDDPLEAPDGLALSLTDSGVNLEWTDNSTREAAFEIERSLDGINFTNIRSQASNDKTLAQYLDSSVTQGTTYHYRVRGRTSSEARPGGVAIINSAARQLVSAY